MGECRGGEGAGGERDGFFLGGRVGVFFERVEGGGGNVWLLHLRRQMEIEE